MEQGVKMGALQNRSVANAPIQPLPVSLELLANLICLSRKSETHSAQQHRYLDWASQSDRGKCNIIPSCSSEQFAWAKFNRSPSEPPNLTSETVQIRLVNLQFLG
jgi:hypothetical protein